MLHEIIATPETETFPEYKQVYRESVDRIFGEIRSDPDNSVYTLHGTGFLVREQMYAFADAAAHIEAQYQFGGLTNDQKEAVAKAWAQDALARTVQDIRSFYQEFVEYSPALPIPTEIHPWGEPAVPRLFARYGNSLYLYEDIVDAGEREGVVVKSIRLVEEALVKAGNTDKVIFVSPAGWTGLSDPECHKDAYVYIFGKQESLALRTKMDHSQSVELLSKLAGENLGMDANLTEKDRIKGIMTKVVVVPDAKFEDIATKIREVLNLDIVWEDDNGGRTYAEMLESIRNRGRIVDLGDRVERLIKEFEGYLLGVGLHDFNDKLIEEITHRIGRIVLEIELAQNNDLKKSQASEMEKYKIAHELLAARSGCSHAPNRKKNSVEQKILCCTCPFCGKQVDAIIKDGMIICPKCHRKRSWNA